MPAADRLLPDLGPDFDQRWRHASRALRRDLIAEIRALYRMLDEDDLPVLAGSAAPAIAPAVPPEPASPSPRTTSIPAQPRQTSLFGGTDKPAPPGDNPFLPPSVRERLQHSQMPSRRPTPALEPSVSPPPASHEQVDLERELRLRLGPVIETLIEAQMDVLKGELRLRLRAEMDKLIAEHLRK